MTAFRIGLTGGIGTGKSTVARLFAGFGVPTIDADEVVHALMEPGQAGFIQTVAAFGRGIVRDGQIDRRTLRQRIFSNTVDRQRLEGILHPMVYRELEVWAHSLNTPYCVLSIPLLIETAPPDFVNRVLVVDCSPEQQMRRVTTRDGICAEDAASVIKAQMARSNRLLSADDVISNDGAEDELRNQVEALHARYLALAQEARSERVVTPIDSECT